jgi:hypothetical protein
MKHAAYLLTLIIACGAVSGCGTLFNLAGKEVCVIGLPQPHETAPFGGVDNDVRWMARGIPPNEWMPGCIAVATADIPLSLAADIVTLPWTVPYWILNRLDPTHDSLPESNPNPQVVPLSPQGPAPN